MGSAAWEGAEVHGFKVPVLGVRGGVAGGDPVGEAWVDGGGF